MSRFVFLLLLVLSLGLIAAPGCPGDDDDNDSGDDDDAGDDDTGDDDTGDDDTGDDDTGDDDDSGFPGDDDDSGFPGDDDDSGPPQYNIVVKALDLALSHTPGTTPCPQGAGSLSLYNNTQASAPYTATFALSAGGDQVFGFATADVESGGTGMATLSGNVPNGGSAVVYAGFTLCSVVSNPASVFTITMGEGADQATTTGTMDITFN